MGAYIKKSTYKQYNHEIISENLKQQIHEAVKFLSKPKYTVFETNFVYLSSSSITKEKFFNIGLGNTF